MLHVKNLDHNINQGKSLSLPQWKVPKGRSSLVLGPSGCGKTTLLHILAGLIPADSGTVSVDQTDIYKLSPLARDEFRGKNIGVVFQTLHLIRSLTVYENLALARRSVGLSVDKADIDGIVISLGIEDFLNRRADTLSYGEAQRVAIARALVNHPKLVLADEPTSSLDDKDFDKVEKVLVELTRRMGVTLVIATHDRRLRDRFDLQLDLGKQNKNKSTGASS